MKQDSSAKNNTEASILHALTSFKKLKDHENETKRELGWMILNFYQKREKEKNYLSYFTTRCQTDHLYQDNGYVHFNFG